MSISSHLHDHDGPGGPDGGRPELHLVAAELLAAAGQRYTANRRIIVEVLDGSPRPLTIPEIIGAGPANARLPQSSVYRNLGVLEQAGVVRRVAALDEFGRFELAEVVMGHHHHLLCTVCGHVEDVTLPAAVERAVDTALSGAADAVGFVGAQHRLDLVGRCVRCR